MILEVNERYKHIALNDENYDTVICYVYDKTLNNLKNFKPNNKYNVKIESYVQTLIRCHFHDVKAKLKRGHEIERGNCDNCIVKNLILTKD